MPLFRQPPQPQQRQEKIAPLVGGAPPATNAVAELTTGIGSAYNAAVKVQPNAGLASGTGTAYDATATGTHFPKVITSSTGEQNTNSLTHVITMPSGVVTGDLVAVFFTNETAATVSVNSGTGWTQLGSDPNGTAARLSVYYKVVTGSGDNLTLDTSGSVQSVHAVYRITAHHAATAPEISSVATGTDDSANPLSLDPAGWGTEDTLWIAAVGWQDNGPTVAGYSETGNQLTLKNSSGPGAAVAVSSAEVTASSRDPGLTFFDAAANWIAYTVAVRPSGVVTSASAGLATGTGSAYNPAISVKTNAGLATGAGAAYSAPANVKPNAGLASGTGTAYNAATKVVSAPGIATGAGNAYQPSVSIATNAALATGTGAAYNATVQVSKTVSAELAAGTGSAYNASVAVASHAGQAAGTGSAHNGRITGGVVAAAATPAGTDFSSTTGATSYATDSWTPTADRLVLVAVANTIGVGQTAGLPDLSGNGLTWELVNTALSPFPDETARCSVFRAWTGSGSTAGALTADFSGVTQNGCLIQIAEWVGADGSLDNGLSAIVQSATDSADSGVANPVVTLSAFARSENATYGAFRGGANPDVGSGFTSLAEGTYSSPTSFLITEWRVDNDTTVDTTTASSGFQAVAVEIKAFATGLTVRAGLASGTGQAHDATVSVASDVQVQAGLATGTGLANNPSPAVAVNAGLATGTGTAYGATEAVAAPIGLATGIGTAHQPSISVRTNAGLVAGTGVAQVPAARVAPNAGLATGVGAAYGIAGSVAPNAGLATGVGAAHGVAAAVSGVEGLATGSGQAYQPTPAIAPHAGLAAGTGEAYDATVSTTAFATAEAGLAEGTGTAHDASTAIQTAAGLASGTGAAYDASVAVQSADGIATGTGEAHQPSVSIEVNSEPASGVGEAFDATVSTSSSAVVQAGLATGVGVAYNATVQTVSGAVVRGPGGGKAPRGKPRFSRLEFEVQRGRDRVTHPSDKSLTPLPLRPVPKPEREPELVEALAGAAEGIGTAYNASVRIIARAEVAIGSGEAFDASVTRTVNAQQREVDDDLERLMLLLGDDLLVPR